MPRKKNPITLEHIRGKAAHLIGALVTALAALKGTPYGHLRDVSTEATNPLRDGFFAAEAVLRLSTATLKTMRVETGGCRGQNGLQLFNSHRAGGRDG